MIVPGEGSRLLATDGSPADRTFCFQCRCSRGCSDGCAQNNSPLLTVLATCNSSMLMRCSPTPKHSTRISRHCVTPNGSSCQEAFRRTRASTALHGRVAIANSRLVAIDRKGVSFKWKDYRVDGPERIEVMTLAPDEFTVLSANKTSQKPASCSTWPRDSRSPRKMLLLPT